MWLTQSTDLTLARLVAWLNDSESAAAGAVRRIVQRFFGGSTSKLLAGMVDEGLIEPEELRLLSRRISRARKDRR